MNESLRPIIERFVRESDAIENQTGPDEMTEEYGPWLAAVDCVGSAQGDEPLMSARLRQWHIAIVTDQHRWGEGRRLAMDDIGRWRTRNVYITSPTGPKTIGAAPEQLAPLIMAFIDGVNRDVQTDGSGLREVATRHYEYERLHPFVDGNGRTGRLVALWMAIRMKTDIPIFTAEDRATEYYPCFPEKTPDRMVAYVAKHVVDYQR